MRKGDEPRPEPALPTVVVIFLGGAVGAVLGLVTYANGWL